MTIDHILRIICADIAIIYLIGFFIADIENIEERTKTIFIVVFVAIVTIMYFVIPL